jgi:hypothetical protein
MGIPTFNLYAKNIPLAGPEHNFASASSDVLKSCFAHNMSFCFHSLSILIPSQVWLHFVFLVYSQYATLQRV